MFYLAEMVIAIIVVVIVIMTIIITTITGVSNRVSASTRNYSPRLEARKWLTTITTTIIITMIIIIITI